MKSFELNFSLKRLFLALILFTSVHLLAQDSHKNIIKITASKTYWSKLLHYEGSKSIIETGEFFLSPNGKTSLEAELEATLSAFKNDPYTKCKYPARYKWLNSLGIVERIDAECKELDRFLAPNFNKISIVFSTERYSAAASLFGHVLLKVDSKTRSNVIEYTADVSKSTSAISYAFKGVFGGFVSKYNFFSFNAKDYEAREQEFRDLVVYELNFSQNEIDNILLHLYEVKDTTQKYYFLTRNCSSELITLLDIYNYDAKERSSSKLFVLPVEVVNSVYQSGKVKNIKLLHSKLKQFQMHYEVLDEDEKNILRDVVFSKRSVHSLIKDTNISKSSKDKIVLSALLYYEIVVQDKQISQKELSKILTLSTYKNNNFLSYGHEYKDIDKNPISPYMYRTSFGFLYKKDPYATIGFRNLYKNRFDLLDGLVKNGSVELFDLELRANDKLSIEHFTLMHLSSMPLSSEFFSEPTKEMSIGLKRLFYDDKLYSYGEYGIGKRMKATNNISYGFTVYGGAYDSGDSLFCLGLKTEIEYKLVSKYLFRFGTGIARYENDNFDESFNDANVFIQMNFKTSEHSLLGTKIEYYDNQDEYFTTSVYYNYSF
ncbi:DUF4105 domain-containing protein [Sulfurimonas sp.]|uniref:lipoprotein N-acyltransferase Lnb domain-containing protein n=1 Tax=Sulfurimonas sp. TaxID=2022749 RepID=UPI003562EC2D